VRENSWGLLKSRPRFVKFIFDEWYEDLSLVDDQFGSMGDLQFNHELGVTDYCPSQTKKKPPQDDLYVVKEGRPRLALRAV
jgi:hypothetical protein